MKKLGRPKLKEEDKKVGIRITVSKKVLEEAIASGNASHWFDEAGKYYKKNKSKKGVKRWTD